MVYSFASPMNQDDMKVSFEQEREQMQTAMQEMKGLISDLR